MDRGVVLLRHSSIKTNLSFLGTFLPSFVLSPTAIALAVNNFVLINITALDLCSHRLGFPSFRQIAANKTGIIAVAGMPGIGRQISPILRDFPQIESTAFYQPICPSLILDGSVQSFWQTEYVVANSLEPSFGIGGIFQEREGRVLRYPATKSNQWQPPKTIITDKALKLANSYVYRHQLANLSQTMKVADPQTKAYLSRELSGNFRVLRRIRDGIGQRNISMKQVTEAASSAGWRSWNASR